MIEATKQLFELAPGCIRIGLTTLRVARHIRVEHILRPPNQQDWLAYARACSIAFERGQHDEEMLVRVDNVEAACALWDTLVDKVTGYAGLPEEDWRQRIPAGHKQTAIGALLDIAPAELDETADIFPLDLEETSVVLQATRGQHYPRLVHHFRVPNVVQRIAYRRLFADSVVVRGSKKFTTLVPARLGRLVKFYDELIVRVEGYMLRGQPITAQPQISAHMDAQHKRAAIELLFAEEEAAIAE